MPKVPENADFDRSGALFQQADRGGLAEQLTQWTPTQWPIATGWQPTVSQFVSSEAGRKLARFMEDRLASGAVIYPPQPFHALDLTAPERIRVVILGQDPYHGPGQAQGLAFSVAAGTALPPSLRNIRKEIARDPNARDRDTAQHTASDGALARWARQGVLLLNTCLTVEQGQAASHAKKGWEVLTDAIVQAAWASSSPVVFMLWGAHAQAKQALFTAASATLAHSQGAPTGTHHLVLTANHPSPLSALRPPKPFIGCGHFGLANEHLRRHGLQAIVW